MYTIYQVMPGDTMSSVATKFKTSMEELRRINSLPFNYDFSVGEQIIVPATNNNPFFYYTVEQGDNIYALARKYNVDLDTLLQINGLNKNDYIYPGNQLIIPKNNIKTYIVLENETLSNVSEKLNTDVQTLINENENIYLLPGQLLIINE